MIDYTSTNSIDLTRSKHFVKSYSNLLKVKKDTLSSTTTTPLVILPPSPSNSTSK